MGESKAKRSARSLIDTIEILNMLEMKRFKFYDKGISRTSLRYSRVEHLLSKIFISGKKSRNATHSFSCFAIEDVRNKDRSICFVASSSCVLSFHLDTSECSHEQTE